jgi:hypothetical protein
MSERYDGGPAFPFSYVQRSSYGAGLVTTHDGMSLRDWFAGQALIALATIYASPYFETTKIIDQKLWSKNSYALADLMLAERKREKL